MAHSTARRPRLTQQERSATTRQALIDATIESLMEVGYERSTTGEISERAGLSRGAHLHHFQTRASLFAAAVEALARRGLADLEAAVERLPTDGRRRSAALEMLWKRFDGQLFQVMIELSVHGRTDPELRANLDPIERMLGDEMTPLLRLAFAGDDRDHGLDDVISMATATVRGIAVMKLLEPSRAATDRRWVACRNQLLTLLDQRSGA